MTEPSADIVKDSERPVRYGCNLCGAEIPHGFHHNCLGALPRQVQELEGRMAALESWVRTLEGFIFR